MRSRGSRRRWGVGALAVLGGCVAVALIGGYGGAAASSHQANLAVSKSDSPDPVAKGGTLVYTIEVRNLGPGSATNASVEDKLPGGLTFLSSSTTAGSCTRQGKTVTCNLGALAASGKVTVTIRTRVTKKSGSIDNTASAESDTPDPAGNNNSDTERTTIRAGAGPTCGGKAATIVGTAANDRIVGTARRDVIVTFAGNDRVFARGGSDLVCTGPGFDLVRGGPRGDLVWGGGKRDRLIGGGGPDVLRGNAGFDIVRGGGGGDILRGNLGRDRLYGNRGPDLLIGGRHVDLCRGGAGRDLLRGCER